MVQAPCLCFSGALDALPKYFFAGVEHDMEDIQAGVTQASKYLLQVSADQNRLRSDEVLAGEPGQFRGGQCWKSDTGWSARLGRSMYPTVSGSNTRLDRIRECSSAAVLVLPQPKVPFSQMIT